MRIATLMTALVLMGCRVKDTDLEDGSLNEDDSGIVTITDVDGDGYSAEEDCNDEDELLHPGASEVCDGIDNNCDGEIDEGVSNTYYEDADGDGFGDADSSIEACESPKGYVPIGNDCNDADETSYPGAPEQCDGVDNDCDGEIDEDTNFLWYADVDGDGFGDNDTLIKDCNPGQGYTIDDGDCDDADADINPDGVEVCDEADNDCDGSTDEGVTSTWYADTDTDGYGDDDTEIEGCDPGGYIETDGDCDDADSAINPDAAEVCDEADNDCDGSIDEGVTSTWYADTDGDSFGDDDTATEGCDPGSGYTETDGDCDDADSAINPDATEVCDEADNDCDGSIDEGVTSTWYADTDGDGYGDDDTATEGCDPGGYIETDGDCDDADADINPDATEVCDEADNDCDGSIDEGVTSTWYADTDGDGYGDDDTATEGCDPGGYTETDGDCDDADSDINPGAAEVCDDIDNDCDGDSDEGLTTATYYEDGDGDGYGDASASTEDCDTPSGYVSDDTDCDDADSDVNPGESEVCNEIDDDCNGSIDDGVTSTWYADTDGDGFGDDDTATEGCDPGSGYTETDGDCDDADSAINPDATEVCDEADNDCDGSTDEGVTSTWYADTDGDGFGDDDTATEGCDPGGYIETDGDCDDADADINPDATEVCDEADNDCDGSTDEGVTSTWYADTDGDGYGDDDTATEGCDPGGYIETDGDCDDADSAINPDATEVCDEADNDCDGSTDEGVTSTFYADADGDGYGDASASTEECEAPSGYVSDDDDCDDADSGVNPGESEECDYVDEDCDGSTDEDFKTGSTYTDEENCGYCGNDCTAMSFDNAASYCDTGLSMPDCDYTCDSGYYDANGDDTDGCECVYVSSDDAPFDGLDADCDGEDGDHDDAIHVSVDGSSAGSGAIDDPVDTISAGIDLAVTDGLVYVLVAEGEYEESVTIEDGINLYGGFDEDFIDRDPDEYASVVVGVTGEPALTAVGVTTQTLIYGFTIEAADGEDPGESSVAVWLEDCTEELTLSDNTITAGKGEDGSNGDHGVHGDDGDDGGDGTDGDYSNCTTNFYGGSGGISSTTSTCTTDTSGGDGGDGACPTAFSFQGDGIDGSGTDPGTAGVGACDGEIDGAYSCYICYIDTSCWNTGTGGSNGGDGGNGSGGTSGASGTISGGMWVAERGSAGDDGEDGSGGAGGGAGSGAEVTSCSTDSHAGGTGAGGGAGGCAGLGGEGGEGGGSSFGVVTSCTSTCTTLPVLTGNLISSDNGGDGGDGGDGGLGGGGGDGGYGGAAARSTAWCGLDGGDGGLGGDAGDGGGAGGGAGGLSYAVYAIDVTPDSTWASAENTLSTGSAGSGGRGGAGGASSNDGDDGDDGDSDAQNW